MIKNYFKTAWRNMVHNKLHSFINVGGLAIGMAIAILIGLWIYDEVSFDRNFKNYDRIAQVIQNVTNNNERQTWFSVPYPLAEEIRKNYGRDFKDVAMAVNVGDHLLEYNDKKIKENGGYFEKGITRMLALDMKRGNWNALDEPASILLSRSAAKAYFGDDDPMNKMLKIDQRPVVKVTGVYEDFPRNSTFFGLNFISTWDFLYASEDGFKNMEDPWRPNFATLLVQLNDDANLATASLRIRDAKLRRVNPQLQKKKPELFLQPMSKWHLYSEFKNGVNAGGAIRYVWMFGIIGVFVLLLACINFMNLSTARSERRAREVGIRKTVGSLRRQLVWQFFNESLVTVFFAFVVSLVLVIALLSFFNTVSGKQITVPWKQPFFWAVSFAFILFTAVVAGSYPALYLSSFRPIKVLKGTFRAGRFAAIPRKVMVVLQFTVSVALIIGTIIVYRQIQYAKDRPVGYTRSGLVAIPLMNDEIHKHFDAVKGELVRAGAIVSIAESSNPTTSLGSSTSGLSWQGKDPDLSIDFGNMEISYDYGKTIGWEFRDGRDFSRDFATDSNAIILNEAAAKFMNFKKPVGQVVTWWGTPFTVIGVVHNLIMGSPYEEPRPTVFTLMSDPGGVATIKLNPSVSTTTALGQVGNVFKKFNPEQPFEFQFTDEEYAKKFTSEVRVGKLASFFALLAIIISSLGLFGLSSFIAEQRTKEIGVRKVLGASVFSLWNLLSKDFLVLVLISFVIATPVAWVGMHKWLMDYDYRITISWEIFVFAGILAALIAVATVSFQSIRAAIANPVKSLRTE